MRAGPRRLLWWPPRSSCSELIRQPSLILAVPAPGQLLSGRSAAKEGCQAVGRRQRNGVFVCLVRSHGTISPWAARIRVGVFFVPSLPVRRRRAWPSPMIAWWAFMDLEAVTPGHVLVVPRLHAAGLEDLDEETSMHVWRIGHRIGRALRRSGLRCEA